MSLFGESFSWIVNNLTAVLIKQWAIVSGYVWQHIRQKIYRLNVREVRQ